MKNEQIAAVLFSYVNQKQVQSPESLFVILNQLFDVDNPIRAKADFSIHPFSKWIQDRYARPSKCVIESYLMSACNGFGDFRIIGAKRVNEGATVFSIVINVASGRIQEAIVEDIEKLGEVDDFINEIICGVANTKLPYVAYTNIDTKLATQIVRSAEKTTMAVRSLSSDEQLCVNSFEKNISSDSLSSLFESFAKFNSTKSELFESFSVWRTLLCNQLFVDFFLPIGDLDVPPLPIDELKTNNLVTNLDSLNEKDLSLNKMVWIIKTAFIIQENKTLVHHLKMIYLQMAIFFKICKNETLANACHGVVTSIKQEESLIMIPAIRAHLERTLYLCRATELEVTGLLSHYRKYGLDKVISFIMRSRRNEISTNNFPLLIDIDTLANHLATMIKTKRKASTICPKDIARMFKTSFFSYADKHFISTKELFENASYKIIEFVQAAWDEIDEYDGSSIFAAEMPAGKPCSNCEKEAKLRCPQCRKAAYCSRSCQEKHWPTHQVATCLKLKK
jgi:hypothetical protein